MTTVTGNYTAVSAGQTLTISSAPDVNGAYLTLDATSADGLLSIEGDLQLAPPSSPGAIYAVETFGSSAHEATFIIGSTGAYSLTGPSGSLSVGYVAGNYSIFQNDGAFSVTGGAAQGDLADGVQMSNFIDQITNNGRFAVSGYSANGVVADFATTVQPAAFANSNAFTVTGVSRATGYNIDGSEGGTLNNSGTITATALAATAIHIGGSYTGFSFDITNTGTLSASATGAGAGMAIKGDNVEPDPHSTTVDAGSPLIHLTNSGTINGGVDLGLGLRPDSTPGSDSGRIINTGVINGDVRLSRGGDDTFDGRGGALHGALYLGSGGPSAHDTVWLGDDGETVVTGNTQATITGGAGADDYVMSSGAVGVISIANFSAAQGDRIDLTALTQFRSLADVLAVSTQPASDTVITVAGAGQITLTGVAKTALTAADFIFAPHVSGGPGPDTFVFTPGEGNEELIDFSAAQGDKIDLSAFTDLHTLADVLGAATQSGSNTVINLGGMAITLDGIQKSTLGASDFILVNPPAPPPAAATPPTSLANNFDGGSTSAVAFRQVSTGDWGYMNANTSGGETWHSIGATSIDYAVIAKGDFNGDGAGDIAFRSKTTGDWGYMSVSPAGSEVWHPGGPTSLTYEALGAGDFDGDGHLDVAFRNIATGGWGFMTPNASGGETWHDVGPSSTSYTVVGIGSFLGDGNAEIAFRNNATGDFGYMSFGGGGQEFWHPMGPTSTDYTAVGYGNFDGDPYLDVAFRNASTGDWGYMSLTPSAETWHAVGSSSTAYAVLGSADYNGDGNTDLAFRNSAGDWGFMSIDGSGHEVWHAVGPSSADYTPL